MYVLLRHVSVREGVLVEAPCLVASLLLAEVWYKFHSFTLECGAFLGTWFVLDAAVQAVLTLTARIAAEGSRGPG